MNSQDLFCSLNKKISLSNKVLPDTLLSSLRELLTASLERLKKDYLPTLSSIDFLDYLHKESYLSRSLSLRFCSAEVIKSLLDPILVYLFGSSASCWTLNPLCYVRICPPGHYINNNHAESYLFTEPHYDRCYGFDAVSIWIPFYDSSPKSGTMCFFDNLDVLSEFPQGGKNRYGIYSYIENHKEIDTLLRSAEKICSCPAGHFLYWGPQVLHGATKPISTTRHSLNFQIVRKSSFADDYSVPANMMRLAEYSLDLCNCINLATLGDVVGSKRIFSGINLSSLSDLPQDLLLSFENGISSMHHAWESGQVNMLKPGNVHWTKEFPWVI